LWEKYNYGREQAIVGDRICGKNEEFWEKKCEKKQGVVGAKRRLLEITQVMGILLTENYGRNTEFREAIENCEIC
jgi:hypothetical protein